MVFVAAVISWDTLTVVEPDDSDMLNESADKVITGVELDIYVYEENSFDVFPSGKINTFFQPITSKRTWAIGNRVIHKDESLEKSNQFCFESTDSTKNCVGYKVSSIHTLNIDL